MPERRSGEWPTLQSGGDPLPRKERRKLLTRPLIGTGLALCLLAARACPAGEAPAAAVPQVRVRLASLGQPPRLELHATAETTVALGEQAPAAPADRVLKLAAKQDQVALPSGTADCVRITAPSLTLGVGREQRTYTGSLLVSARNGRLLLSNECPLDDYVAGVLTSECPSSFHPEAIKAHAVAVRSYTFRKAFIGRAELCDGTHCQVFRGSGRVPASIRAAVRETSGVCATFDGEVIDAVYSADCGGSTEANEAVWKGARPLPYLRPVLDAPAEGERPYCSLNRSHAWSLRLTAEHIRRLAGRVVDGARVVVQGLTGSGRVSGLVVEAGPAGPDGMNAPPRAISGEQVRRLLGSTVLRSLNFHVVEAMDGLRLEGRGYGHGVGLCQFGAQGMALAGRRYEEILRHYYTGVSLEPLPDATLARTRFLQGRMASALTPGAGAPQ